MLVVSLQTNPAVRLKHDENKESREEVSSQKWARPVSAAVKAEKKL